MYICKHTASLNTPEEVEQSEDEIRERCNSSRWAEVADWVCETRFPFCIQWILFSSNTFSLYGLRLSAAVWYRLQPLSAYREMLQKSQWEPSNRTKMLVRRFELHLPSSHEEQVKNCFLKRCKIVLANLLDSSPLTKSTLLTMTREWSAKVGSAALQPVRTNKLWSHH